MRCDQQFGDRPSSKVLDDSMEAVIKRQAQRIKALEEAVKWANGEGDDFPERRPGEGMFWWRKELMRRAALEGSDGR